MIGRFQNSRKAPTAWITLAVVLPLYVVSYLLSLTRPEIQRIPPFTFNDALWEGTYVTLSVVGALVAARRPANRIGWVLLATGASASIPYVSFEYAVLSLLTASGLPGGEIAAWLSVWSWAPSVALFVVVLLLFPNGELPSPRWRWVVWVVAVPAVLIALFSAVGTWDRRGPLLLVGLADAGVGWLERVVDLLFPMVLLAALIAMASLIVRYRRADSVERLQLKWVVLAATLMAAGLIMGETTAQAGPYHAISELIGAPIWFPIAAGIAITRYRLYDFDRIISRTVSYLLVVGLLGATFVGLVTGVSSSPPTTLSRSPGRPWWWQRCPTRCGVGCRAWWIIASTGLGMTSSG